MRFTTGLVDVRELFDTPMATMRREVDRRYHDVALGLAASDAIAICVALTLSYWMRFGVRSMSSRELVVVGVAPLVWVLVFQAYRLYNPLHLSPAEEFRRTISAAGVGMVLLVMASYWSKSSFSRGWIGLTWCLALLLELLVRRMWRLYLHRRKLDGRLALRTLIIGSTGEAVQMAQVLDTPGSGFVPLGYVQPIGSTAAEDTLPVLGGIERLRDVIREQTADCLFVASTIVRPEDIALVSHAARREGVEVLVSANVTHVLTSRLALQQVGSLIALSLRPVRLTGKQAVMKRAFDLVVASLLLVITVPILLGAMLAIRLTTRGPMLFHQERVTRGGRTFRMHKLRTMHHDFPLPDAVRADMSVAFFKRDHDHRVTTVGRLLRKWSLDELPQLWNVIRGEMSLVGPRPLPTEQVAGNLELLGPRHEVPAGVTGWWQINGRSDVGPEEAVRLDTFYIENWSLAFDLYIILKTFGTVIKRKGAY
jgi:exopolysaccharide biosynthesis polyprenyl glycosylphosphotransferase